MRIRMILPALTEAASPVFRPVKYSLFPPGWPWRRAAWLSASVAVAAAPPAIFIRLEGPFPGGWSVGSFGVYLEIIALVTGMLVTVPVTWVVAAGCRVRAPGPTAVLLIAIQAAVTVMLSVAAPFRPGLLSVVLYWAPEMCLAAAVLQGTSAARFKAGVLVVAVVSVAVPVHLLQQIVAAQEWLRVNGVPSRAYVQVISLPGVTPEPYQWDSRTGTLTEDFSVTGEFWDGWAGTETVTRGGDPCGYGGPVDPTRELFGSPEANPADCIPAGPDLWQRTSDIAGVTAYILRAGDLTITVVTGDVGPSALESAVLAHHPASDADLWALTSPYPRSVAEWIFL